jgi:Holliday junction resolvasome RuvABC endonuclease subunit
VSARVVGLDLSMTATGVVDATGKATTIKPTQKGDERLVYIAALTAVASRDANLVAIEDLPTHAHSAGITGMVHGAARLVLLNQGIRYVLITPATLKKYATGRGNAGKPEMAVALFKRAGLELADDNQVDAWWLRAAGHELLGEPLIPMPSLQVAALDKVRAAMAVAS